MPHVFSTLSNDNCYTNYEKGGADMPVIRAKVLIKGGTNVANARLITPLGVVTTVTDEELVELERNPVFQKHKEKGFVRVEKKKHDPEKVAGGMKTRDLSAPLVPGDYSNDQPTPVIGKAKKAG